MDRCPEPAPRGLPRVSAAHRGGGADGMMDGRPKRYLIETWGCQMNQHDTEKMSGILEGLGFTSTPDPSEADVILLNTCSVRDKAESKVFGRLGRLRRLKRDRPDLVIGV